MNEDEPVFIGGVYLYPEGIVPESDAIEGLSTMHEDSTCCT